jgi:hypothetical protein
MCYFFDGLPFIWLLAAQPFSKYKEFVIYLQLMNAITVQVFLEQFTVI